MKASDRTPMTLNIKEHYQIKEHNGDLAILVLGRDLGEVFAHAGLALFDLMTDLNRIESRQEERIDIEAQDIEQLMINWLGELLYLFDTQGLLFNSLEVEEIAQDHLKATGRGERYDPDRHVIQTVIKAATYHHLKIGEEGGQWQASIIFDL